jgi:hypothetical protein
VPILGGLLGWSRTAGRGPFAKVAGDNVVFWWLANATTQAQVVSVAGGTPSDSVYAQARRIISTTMAGGQPFTR